ncbi:MAG: MoaD/ThiS family protein [Gemmatimonadales bacterium]
MTSRATLRVRCRFFARYHELLGREQCDLELPVGATVRDAVSAVRELTGARAAGLPDRPLVAVNREHALYDRLLADGDEMALLPPLAGG